MFSNPDTSRILCFLSLVRHLLCCSVISRDREGIIVLFEMHGSLKYTEIGGLVIKVWWLRILSTWTRFNTNQRKSSVFLLMRSKKHSFAPADMHMVSKHSSCFYFRKGHQNFLLVILTS